MLGLFSDRWPLPDDELSAELSLLDEPEEELLEDCCSFCSVWAPLLLAAISWAICFSSWASFSISCCNLACSALSFFFGGVRSFCRCCWSNLRQALAQLLL